MWYAISYEDKYLIPLLELTKSNYGDIEISNDEFVKHQYFENPIGDAIVALAVDNNSQCLVGQYSVCPMKIKILDEELTCVLSLNTLTRSSHRRQGIFKTLAEFTYTEAQEIAKFCYGVPNPNSYPGFLKKLNFKQIGTIPLFLKPIKPSKMIKERLNSSLLSTLAFPLDLFFKGKETKNNFEIVKITEENLTLMDDFWGLVYKKYPVMFVRDSQYVKWRYIETPKKEYFPYMILRKGRPVAFTVGRVVEVANMMCGMLADFLILPDAEAEGQFLLRFMRELFDRKGVSLMGCLMQKKSQEAKLLKKSGFFVCPKIFEPQPFPIILKIFDENLKNTDITDFNKWFFTMGDYDAI